MTQANACARSFSEYSHWGKGKQRVPPELIQNPKHKTRRTDLVEQEAQCPAQGSSSSHLGGPVAAVQLGNRLPRLT